MLHSCNDSQWDSTVEIPCFKKEAWTVFLSTNVEVTFLTDVIIGMMTELEYPSKDTFGTRLVLEEALVNAVKHGNKNDPQKKVKVRIEVNRDFVLVEVKDQGLGFDLGLVPDPTATINLERPCGRGLLLIDHYASWVRFNETGNCITICKYPSGPLENRD